MKSKLKPETQRMLTNLQSNVEWACRMMSESAVPWSVDIDRVAKNVKHVLAAALAEREASE